MFTGTVCLQARREKISERMKILQDLVPGCNKVQYCWLCAFMLVLLPEYMQVKFYIF